MSASTITIGGTTKDLKDADPDWIASQLNGRKHGSAVCVRVRIKTSEIDIGLSSGACPASGGGGHGSWRPNGKEIRLIDLWNRKHLNEVEFSIGDLVSFVNDARRDL